MPPPFRKGPLACRVRLVGQHVSLRSPILLTLYSLTQSNGAIQHNLSNTTDRPGCDRQRSPSTRVGVHVSRILAKLGVAGRGEAAAIAHRLGLDEQ
jgi:hypothetical protein